MADRPVRASDRWLTPGVVCVLILVGGGLVALVVVLAALLTVRGYDPAPIVQLTGSLAGSAFAFGTFIVQLVTRKTTTKVEREAGRLASGVYGVLDELDATRGRHTTPPLPLDEDEDSATQVRRLGGATPAVPPPANIGQDTSTAGETRQGVARQSVPYPPTREKDLRDTAWFTQ